MKILFCSFLLLGSILCYSQEDSLNYRVLGAESGYLNHASIDELFIPYVFSGSTLNFSLFTRKYKSRSRIEIRTDFAHMNRKPENIVIPQYYRVLSSDSIKSEDEFRISKTYISSITVNYLRKLKFHLLPKDEIFLGFQNNNSMIFRNYVEDIELLSFKISPGFLYLFNFDKVNRISFYSYMALFGLNLRKPYAGTVAQISDSFNAFDYFFENLRIDFFNNYININSRINYERSLYDRLVLNFFYDFTYVNLSYPRKLTSVSDIYGLGLYYKFGKNGK